MKKGNTKIQRVGERGQITLPKAWRDAHKASLVRVRAKAGALEITPVDDATEEVVWSAVRDNKGKGISAEDFLSVLDKAIKAK